MPQYIAVYSYGGVIDSVRLSDNLEGLKQEALEKAVDCDPSENDIRIFEVATDKEYSSYVVWNLDDLDDNPYHPDRPEEYECGKDPEHCPSGCIEEKTYICCRTCDERKECQYRCDHSEEGEE